eukprot:TRINITY_DN2982_c0_g1_i1.p1 TRINITY_DN2982_c0_g1~~TRINITY_DN2982_c0_g1_i1.p1  ORF type:complete len:113 (-),score=23.25 TRINITY_DN2982_c0_g1_i1:35-373(-)
MAAVYLSMKIKRIWGMTKNSWGMGRAFIGGGRMWGRYATGEEVMESGGNCSICQEGVVREAVVLQCGHLYCEECIGQWLEKNNTCPLCRQVVQSAGVQSHNDGTTSMYVQVF